MGIEIHLLGTPRIQVDGKDIFFTYGKVQALIYYMVVKGVALRDEISGLLWPEKSEVNARKNLRNAIYEAKKAIGGRCICITEERCITMESYGTYLCGCTSISKEP